VPVKGGEQDSLEKFEKRETTRGDFEIY